MHANKENPWNCDMVIVDKKGSPRKKKYIYANKEVLEIVTWKLLIKRKNFQSVCKKEALENKVLNYWLKGQVPKNMFADEKFLENDMLIA